MRSAKVGAMHGMPHLLLFYWLIAKKAERALTWLCNKPMGAQRARMGGVAGQAFPAACRGGKERPLFMKQRFYASFHPYNPCA